MPRPTDVGMPYEDVTLTCSDGVKVKAYVIPARQKPVQLDELLRLSPAERKKKGDEEVEKWTQEMGEGDALAFAKSRPTIIIFHANAGEFSV